MKLATERFYFEVLENAKTVLQHDGHHVKVAYHVVDLERDDYFKLEMLLAAKANTKRTDWAVYEIIFEDSATCVVECRNDTLIIGVGMKER